MALKRSFKTHILDLLVKSFAEETDDQMFLYIARPSEWTDESSTDLFTDSSSTFYDTWNRMIAAKRITDSDVFLMADKNEWTSGTVYVQYEDSIDMSGSKFYVTTSENNVYKCIFNNYGAKSTDSPRGSSTGVITTNDGYKWKFLFRIPEIHVRYITDTQIPIRDLKIDNDVLKKYDDDRHLQYTAQLNAVNGSIEHIKVGATGDVYPASVSVKTSGNLLTRAISGSLSNIVFNQGESNTEDYYNGYTVRIVSGTGVGQIREISDYVGSTRTATVTPDFIVAPDATSFYEIMPKIFIDGDGASASATCTVKSDSQLSVNTITMLDKGRGYSWAEASVATSNGGNGATLTPVLSKYGGHASSPTREIEPNSIMILTMLESTEGFTGDFDRPLPSVNDFRQYGLIKNPIINSGYTGEGRVAGLEVDVFNTVKVQAATGGIFSSFSFSKGDVVFGVDSKTCGEVEEWNRETDFSKGRFKLSNVRGDFTPNEKMITVQDTGSDTWTSSSTDLAFFKFQDETVSSRTSNNYRLSTRLVVDPTGSDASHTYVSSNWTEDMGITGASGSSSVLVSATNTGVAGGTAEILVTSIKGASSAGDYGFTAGENLVGTSIETVINSVEPPQFVYGSGEIIQLENITKIERHHEQEEELKIIIDLT